MTRYLLIDFGTTSTKSVLVDLDSGVFSNLQRHASIASDATVPQGRHEVSLSAISQRFNEICAHYYDLTRTDPFAGIVVCSEMHGFAVLDGNTYTPLTPYISWLDQRSLEPVDGVDTFALVTGELRADRCRAITGMRPRPGFPLMNLVHWVRTAPCAPDCGVVVSLPGWLAFQATRASETAASAIARPGDPPPEHPTILAGMAFFDVSRGENSAELLDCVLSLTGFSARLGPPASADTVGGYWTHGDSAVPIYTGVGDHQCSLLGAGLTDSDISLNLGTGSQASVLTTRESATAAGTVPSEICPDDAPELRPYFDDGVLRTITHIPAGRALNEYVGFLHRIVAAAHSEEDGSDGGQVDFWLHLASLTAADVARATLEVDLAVFEGARHYRHGGRIAGIVEGSLTPHNYLSSLLKSFVAQYRQVLQVLDPDHRQQQLLLSGGIARNLPNLCELFTSPNSGYAVSPAAQLDESLLGLRTLALVADGRAASCREAQRFFASRNCEVTH